MLRAQILFSKDLLDDAVRSCKLAAPASQSLAEQTKAMDLLDQVMAARIIARRKADELERAAQEAKKRAEEDKKRVEELLDRFSRMQSYEVRMACLSCLPSSTGFY